MRMELRALLYSLPCCCWVMIWTLDQKCSPKLLVFSDIAYDDMMQGTPTSSSRVRACCLLQAYQWSFALQAYYSLYYLNSHKTVMKSNVYFLKPSRFNVNIIINNIGNSLLVIQAYYENVKVPAEKNVKFVHAIKYLKIRVSSPPQTYGTFNTCGATAYEPFATNCRCTSPAHVVQW